MVRDRVISRQEITDVGTSSFGVGVGYERDGRRRFVTAGAGQGLLNSLGSRMFREQNRAEAIAAQVRHWQQTGQLPGTAEAGRVG